MAAPLALPILRTARLTLEPFALTAEQTAGMFRLWSHPEVCRFSGLAADADGQPIALPARSARDSDRILDFFVRRAAAGLGCRWAVFEAGPRAFAGAVGFNHLSPTTELAYHLHPDAWGRGLMTEAARAVLAWREDAPKVEAFIEPGNAASIRLAHRLGFRPTGEVSDGAGRYVLER